MNNTITQKITKEDIKNLAKYIEITSDMVIDKLIELNLMVPKTHMVTLFAINEELKFNTHKSKKKRPGDHTNIFKYLLHRLSTDEELAIYHIVFLIKTIEKHANYEKKNGDSSNLLKDIRLTIVRNNISKKLDIEELEHQYNKCIKNNPQFFIKLFSELEKENILDHLIKLDNPIYNNNLILYNKYQLENNLVSNLHNSKSTILHKI